MMKRLAILALLTQISAVAAFGETKEGTCQLMLRKGFEKDVFQVSVGEKVKGTCKFFVQDFLGKKVINAGVSVLNTSDKAMYCQYYVAFFNSAGNLIGCAGQGTFDKTGLAAGEAIQLGSCLIPLPAGFHEKAVQYKIAFYESDKEIGKDAIVDIPSKTAGLDRPQVNAVPRQSTSSARKWMDATGKYTVEAELVELKDGVVRLKKQNGQIINLPLEKLSKEDQEFLRNKINEAGVAPVDHRTREADTGSWNVGSKQANTRTQQEKWFSAGPAWEELNKVAQSRKILLQSSNHGEKQYKTILSQSQPGSTIVLLFALDNSDKDVPAGYQDLLPVPWAQIQAELQKGETVEASGRSRDREIILLAAPNESHLKHLIHTTKLLSPNPANR